MSKATSAQPRAVELLHKLYEAGPYAGGDLDTIRRDVLASIQVRRMRSRVDTSRFENGRISLTRQLLARGLEVLVAGRDRAAYRPEEWQTSRTFWQSEQENLLVSDNQTEKYARADFQQRQALCARAWGSRTNRVSNERIQT